MCYDPLRFSLSFLICSFSFFTSPIKKHWRPPGPAELSDLLVPHPIKKTLGPMWAGRPCRGHCIPVLKCCLCTARGNSFSGSVTGLPAGIMPQDCSAYSAEPLRTVGLLEAAHQYSLQYAKAMRAGRQSAGRWYVLATQGSLHPVLSCCLCTARGTSFFLLCYQPVTIRRLSCARTAQLTPRSPCAPRAC